MLVIFSLVDLSVMRNSELLVMIDPLNDHWIVVAELPASCRIHLNDTSKPLNAVTYDIGVEIVGDTIKTQKVIIRLIS